MHQPDTNRFVVGITNLADAEVADRDLHLRAAHTALPRDAPLEVLVVPVGGWCGEREAKAKSQSGRSFAFDAVFSFTNPAPPHAILIY